MCRRMTIFEFDDLLGIIQTLEFYTPFNLRPDWPARPKDAFPNDRVPLLITSDAEGPTTEELDWNKKAVSEKGTGRIVPSIKQWGFETEERSQVVFNTRIETADELPLWKDSIEKRRCVVPVQAFYESHGTEMAISSQTGRSVKQLYRFTDDVGLLLLAGIWKNDRFSVVTTEPNASVAAVHDRMPLVLSQSDVLTWLTGDWRSVPRTSNVALASAPLYQPQPSVDQPRLF